MCGFFHVVERDRPVDRNRFEAALRSMRHRGPDQSGQSYLQKPIGEGGSRRTVSLAFGHQRLAILDLSERSRQPFVIDRDVLLYNGEIYNFRELNEDLARCGHKMETNGDTETLFKSIRHLGSAALQNLNGMWSFAMYRDRDAQILLSRDRYGKKPLFYFQDDHTFCVSSTIHAIQVYLQRKFTFRREALLPYLIFSTLYPSGTAATHYEGIFQILPGHWGVFDLAAWRLRQEGYFPFYDENLQGKVESDRENLSELLKDSVRKRLISDRPVALLLSGGIDSTLILSTLFSLGLQDQCRIYMGDTGRSLDYQFAKQCADKLGVAAITVRLDYDHNTFERFLEVCRHQEKPVSLNGSTMGMPQMYEEISSQGVPVVLDGTGGDEIFGGYWQRQFPYAVRDALRAPDWKWLWHQWCAKDGGNSVKAHVLRSLIPGSLVAAQRASTKRLKAVAYPYFKTEIGTILSSSPPDPLENPAFCFTKAICADLAPGGRLGEWLWHNDRNSMRSGVEARSPLLDHRLNRFAYTGFQNKFSAGWNKFELRHAFDALTPLPSQWRRQKQGFRWDGKHFLYNNKARILELIRSNRCLEELVDIPKLVSYAHRHPKLLRSTFCKQVLAISGVEHALASP